MTFDEWKAVLILEGYPRKITKPEHVNQLHEAVRKYRATPMRKAELVMWAVGGYEELERVDNHIECLCEFKDLLKIKYE